MTQERVAIPGTAHSERTAMAWAERSVRRHWREVGHPRKVRAISAERRRNHYGPWWSVLVEVQ